MPTYDYICDECGHEFEAYESITAEPRKDCPECSRATLRRKIGPGAAILFKGSGSIRPIIAANRTRRPPRRTSRPTRPPKPRAIRPRLRPRPSGGESVRPVQAHVEPLELAGHDPGTLPDLLQDVSDRRARRTAVVPVLLASAAG